MPPSPDVFTAYRDPSGGTYGLWDKAHDFYPEGAITLGLAFVAAVVVVYGALGAIWTRGWRVRRRLRIAPAVGIAITVLVTLHDTIDFSLQIPGLAVAVAAAAWSWLWVASLLPRGTEISSERAALAHVAEV